MKGNLTREQAIALVGEDAVCSVERCAPNHGTAQHGAIGDTRIPRFYVTDGDGAEYVVYFD